MPLTDATLTAIAGLHPPPFYCYDAQMIRDRYRLLRDGLPGAAEIYYSAKANPSLSVLRLFQAEGAGAEVSSLSEYRLARQAGMHPDRILVVGPGKSDREIGEAVGDGVQLIVAESLAECHRISAAASLAGRRQRVALRINPSFSVSDVRHKMSGVASQFGIDDAQIGAVAPVVDSLPGVDLVGIQVYLGARVLDHADIVATIAQTLKLGDQFGALIGRPLGVVDVGGGFGIPLFEGEPELQIVPLLDQLNRLITAHCAARPGLRVFFEIGRYLVAPAGVFVTRVRDTKACKGKRFAICDGGANMHCSAAGYGNPERRNWPIRRVGGRGDAEEDGTREEVTVAGPLCTPIDTLAVDALLPRLRPGDLLRIDQSGAYGPTHSPVYFLGHGFPAELMLDNGALAVVRAADTVEDLLSKHVHKLIGRVDGDGAAAQTRPAPAGRRQGAPAQ